MTKKKDRINTQEYQNRYYQHIPYVQEGKGKHTLWEEKWKIYKKKTEIELVEMKYAVFELKHTWDGINSRLTAEEKKKKEGRAKEPSTWNTETRLKKDN